MKHPPLSIIGACIVAWSASTAQTQSQSLDLGDSAAIRERLVQAEERIGAGDCASVARLLLPILEPAVLATLERHSQYFALKAAAVCAGRQQRYKEANALLKRVTALAWADDGDMKMRYESALWAGDIEDAAVSLAILGRKWPDSLRQTPYREIYEVLNRIKIASGKDAVFLDLLNALFDAEWKVENELEPNYAWLELAVLSIERNDIERAREVVLRITDPYRLVSLRADLRFAAIVADNPSQFDISAKLEAEIAQLQAAVDRAPTSTPVISGLAAALIHANRPQASLDLLDKTLAAIFRRKTNAGAEDLNWILNARSRALFRLGRADEALDALERAQQLFEHGVANVSQTINLAGTYCNIGQTAKARELVSDLERVSPYGRMQVERIRLCAAIQEKNIAAKQKALRYLEEHQQDAFSTYESALLVSGEIEAAGRLLTKRLMDPRKRNDALLEVQKFELSPIEPPPIGQTLRANWYKMMEQQFVLDTIAQVGRIEEYSIQAE